MNRIQSVWVVSRMKHRPCNDPTFIRKFDGLAARQQVSTLTIWLWFSSSTTLICLLDLFICLLTGHVTEGSGDAQGQQIVARGFVIHKKITCNLVYFVISNKYERGGKLYEIIKGNHSINQSICSYWTVRQGSVHILRFVRHEDIGKRPMQKLAVRDRLRVRSVWTGPYVKPEADVVKSLWHAQRKDAIQILQTPMINFWYNFVIALAPRLV